MNKKRIWFATATFHSRPHHSLLTSHSTSVVMCTICTQIQPTVACLKFALCYKKIKNTKYSCKRKRHRRKYEPRIWPLALTAPSPCSVSRYHDHEAASPAALSPSSVHASGTWQCAYRPEDHGTQSPACRWC